MSSIHKQTKTNLEKQVNQLTHELDEKKEALNDLKSRLANQTQDLKSELETSKRSLHTISNENASLVLQNQKITKRSKELESELSEVMLSWNSDKKTVAMLKEKFHTLKTKSNKLETEVEVLKADNKTLKSVQVDLEQELNEDMIRMSELRNEVSKQKNSIFDAKSSNERLQQKILEKENTIIKMKDEVEELRSQLPQGHGKSIDQQFGLKNEQILQDAKGKVAGLESSMQSLKFDNERLKRVLQHKENELNNSMESLQKSRKIAKSEAEKHAKLTAKYRELEASLRTLQRELKRSKSDKEFTNAALNEKLQQANKHFDAERVQLKEKLHKTEAALKELKETENSLINGYKTKALDYQQQCAEWEARCQEITFQISSAKQHEEMLVERLRESEGTTTLMIEKNARLTEEVQTLELDKLNLTMEIETIEGNQKNMESELGQSLNQIKLLQENLSNARTEHSVLEDELNETKSRLLEAEEEGEKLVEQMKTSTLVSQTTTSSKEQDPTSVLTVEDLKDSASKSNIQDAHQSYLVIQKKLDVTEKEVADLKIENATLQSTCDNALDHSQRLKTTIETLKHHMAKKQEHIQSVESKLHDANIKLGQIENDNLALQQKFENSKQQSVQKIKQLGTTPDDKTEVRREIPNCSLKK